VPPVRGDAERLTQVFANLISNAHKYTAAGGTLTVSATDSGSGVSVSVADTGIGLTREEQEQLFTRFYRAQNRTTQEVGGTGLGLSITRSLIELHGGTITVESMAGEGTTFTVTLPRAVDEVATTLNADGTDDAHGRILIVEDEPDIARLIRRYLERAGYEVHIASDAATALHVARETPLDLITLDVILPDTDGFTLLEWLKNDTRTSGIPVIMLSRVADEGQGRSLGAVDYLVKPIREDALLQRISRLLASNRSGTVLVADDEADVRRLLARQLARAGYQVLEAENGEEAARIATTQDLDAVFLDIRMPVMDGFSALKSIRAVRTEAELPIVMMTASPGAADAAQGMLASLGIADLLQKPISAEELARTIATSMKREREVRI
jgi:DNA-binding response OmpR family regulator